jgi:ATP-dependent Clp protease protease subunit
MSASDKLEEIFEFGIDVKTRRVFFGDSSNEFTEQTVNKVVRAIKFLENKNKKPIELHVNSLGGDVVSMMYLIDVILNSPCKIIFIGGGAVMSSAAWIMVVCDERRLYENTAVMIHEGRALFNEAAVSDLKISFKEMERFEERATEILASNSNMPIEFWKKALKRDLYLTANEALVLGIADKIIKVKKHKKIKKLSDVKLAEYSKQFLKRVE